MIREFTPDRFGDSRTQNLSFVRSDDKYRSLWQYLKRYGNADYNDAELKRLYPSMDDDLRAAKAQHIADAIRQGEAYFNTARKSELAIKPLILYYGALNLVKALLMYADNDNNLDNSVQRAHGLTKHGLSNGAFEPSDIAIRNDNDNLLEEFALASPVNKTVFSLLHNCWSDIPLPNNTRIELGDLASMHPSSWRNYTEFTGNIPKYFKVDGESFRTTARGDEHAIMFSSIFQFLTYQDTIPSGSDAHFEFFERYMPRLKNLYEREPSQPYLFYTKVMPTSLDEFQPCYREATGSRFTMADASIGQPLHLIEVEFLMLFILGSLTRYVPQKWLQNVQYEGRGEMFVVEGFINSVAFSFPKLILEELELREYTFTGDVSYIG